MASRIIAYTSTVLDGKVVIRNSEDDTLVSSNLQEILEFIGEEYTDLQRTIPYRELKVAFDLDQFVAPILKLLPMSRIKELASPTHSSGNMFYIPSKLFSLEVNGHKSYIYHLQQYYDDIEPPTDPMVIAGLTENVVDAYRQLGLNPYKLTSPVAVYESSVMSHLELPTILNIPGEKEEEVIDFAEACIGRLWISAYQLGHWDIGELYSYDIQSAFPYWASQLYSIKYAKFAKARFICPDAHWGFVKARIVINDNVKVSPILHKNSNGDMYNPSGSFEDVITLQEWQFIEKWGIGKVDPIEGWFIKFSAPVKPMEVSLQRLFDLRNKGGMVKTIAKRIANGACYGKFIEKHDDGTTGNFYNPLWATMVSTQARLQVADFIYQNNLQDHLVHIGVDGVLTTKKVSIPDKVAMGYWRLNDPSATLVLSPGRVYTRDKKPQGLNYETIIKLFEEHPRGSYYTARLMRRQTLAESIEANDLKHLGDLKETNSSVDFNLLRTSQDRYFKDFPKCGQDILNNKYQSETIKI